MHWLLRLLGADAFERVALEHCYVGPKFEVRTASLAVALKSAQSLSDRVRRAAGSASDQVQQEPAGKKAHWSLLAALSHECTDGLITMLLLRFLTATDNGEI